MLVIGGKQFYLHAMRGRIEIDDRLAGAGDRGNAGGGGVRAGNVGQMADADDLLIGGGAAEAEVVNGVKLAARNLGEVPAKDLKGLAEAILKQQETGVVALVSTAEGKASIVVAVSADLAGKVNAVDLVRAAAAAVGGKGGGGRPDLAQAGGPDGGKADEALAAVRGALG